MLPDARADTADLVPPHSKALCCLDRVLVCSVLPAELMMRRFWPPRRLDSVCGPHPSHPSHPPWSGRASAEVRLACCCVVKLYSAKALV